MNGEMTMNQDQPQDYNGSYTGNTFMNRTLDNTAIQYRLNTDNALRKFEMFLRSERITVEEINGEPVERVVQVARPKMNEEGVQTLMGFLDLTIGSHNVQGNFTADEVKDFICEINIALAENINANKIHWEMRNEDYNMVIDTIMTTIQPFFSRTKDNLERISYGQSMLTKETNVMGGGEKKGILKSIFG